MKKRILVLTSVCVVGMIGCALFKSLGGKPSYFNHKKHAEADAQCEVCHESAAKDEHAGMPTIDVCVTCHDKITDEQARANPYLASVKEQKPIEWRRIAKPSADLIFSHAKHLAAKVNCVSCHGEVEKTEALTAANLPTMDSCTACHAEKEMSQDCEICHKEIRKNVAPASHRQIWQRRHGQVVLEEGDRSLPRDCSYCHTEGQCISCHADTKPSDHSNQWRHIGHGIASGIDRNRCEMCHRSDYCERCHNETAPRSHRGNWGRPGFRHCQYCHLPVNNSVSNCLTCHREIQHEQAPRMPTGAGWFFHTPNAVCRACHGATLTHPDNRDACLLCH